MNKIPLVAALACSLSLFSLSLHADQLKVKASGLSPQDAANLRGKSVAVTFHPPNFLMFWQSFGGNPEDFLAYRVRDPAALARIQLSNTLKDALEANVRAMDESPAPSAKPEDLAEMHRETDFVLSVRYTGGIVAPAPGGNMVSNHLHMQLIETASGRIVSNAKCNATTYKHPSSPSLDALLESNARLLKDILLSLSWRCTRQFAIQGLGVTADQAPVIPQESIDPLAGRPITTVMGARRASREKRAENAERNTQPKD
ncbi:hypothetical protein [Lysobacter brunescens]|uniref:Secreted protein n=1 Tax=Lysobacter brunescens TaxID=262323 RepID=A0ABW2YBK8_9GAMM